jgi:hypothetical protein
MRSSLSTQRANLTPTFRLHVREGSSGSTIRELIWEGAYNGYTFANPVPVDEWIFTDMLNARFHRTVSGVERTQTLSQWINELGGESQIRGISVGVGSGWGTGQFIGFADNVTLGFGDATPTTWNFNVTNTPATVIPEPMSMALLGTGLAGLYGVRRRRRRNEEEHAG